LPKAVSGDTVNAPFRQQCESEAEWVLNNGEREFEPEQVAPRAEFELLLTALEDREAPAALPLHLPIGLAIPPT
jgi:hypothetical protein